VEEALARHPAIADVGVIGVADSLRGESTRVYVALQAGQAPTAALRRELIEFCRDAIAVYKLPREVEFVPQLPRAPPAGPGTGKLLRRMLREQAERG
jgi:acyl-coenzyme A synthetase/AMP-(fatty) acid ligase